MTPIEWILSDDTGVSSKAIWAVMMGEAKASKYRDIPHDPSDFGRCHRLLKAIPEWKPRLHEVAKAFPKWGPIVREWDHMAMLYERDLDSGKSKELYQFMHDLRDECMAADGWTKTGHGSWSKDTAFCGVIS